MAAMNKSLAQINKSQDGGQSDQEAFGSTRCSRAERAEFYFDPLCQLAPACQWLGLFPSTAAMNKSLAWTNKSWSKAKATKKRRGPTGSAAQFRGRQRPEAEPAVQPTPTNRGKRVMKRFVFTALTLALLSSPAAASWRLIPGKPYDGH
jgi:hypothetical protein